ncbi:NAD-dependent epimerase/dehydratase family protein [Rubrobacter marinus]|uniref:NAD-dependent epimerase/dehydratase family protein n=1 Tax=Rubrobacter marinus TaxID=2653852 RepID=A0A6G8Q235_9ACTN|nr:NAD-dependent epimerase/dehydratase family protein [Rubrobacter marinus]QIN80541.1 NAD-dependent epimerase/dehydratase family protein [Rubrobacter marinus]
MDRQKVLVTGGAGFLGINLIRHLMARGFACASFDVEEFDYPERDRVEITKGDIRDKAALDRAMEGVDFVVHTAAALPLYSAEDIHTTDVEGTRNVLDTARRHGVKRVAHISSTAVYGIPDHHPLYEDDKLEGVGPYGQAKIQAEMVCLEYRARGMVVPIIRPKSFIGPERLGVFALLYDWAYTGHNFPMIGSGNNRYQLLDVEDLCDAIHLTLTLPEDRVNDTFNIGAEEFTTMKEDYGVVLDHAGHGKKVVGFPAAPAIVGLRVLDRLGVSPLYKWVYETASKDSFVSIEKAKKQLGYAPKFSNKDALLRNFRWYLENRKRFENASGVSHRVPWKQGAIGLLKRFF